MVRLFGLVSDDLDEAAAEAEAAAERASESAARLHLEPPAKLDIDVEAGAASPVAIPPSKCIVAFYP